MSYIEAIIFDLEGVIIDTEPLWTSADLIFLNGVGHRITLEEYERELKPLLMGRTLPEGVALLKDRLHLSGSLDDLESERRKVVKQTLADGANFIPGFSDFYTTLREYRMGVATALEPVFLSPLDISLNLSGLFNNHVYSIANTVRVGKPRPDIFLFVARQLNVNPDGCIVIEDAPNGIQAAKAAGMRTIALTTSTTKENLKAADLIVNTYSEIELSKF